MALAKRTIETETYIILYNTIDESFDHAFGTHRQYGYELESVKYYVAEVDKFIELGDDLGKFESFVNNAIDNDIGTNGYFDERDEDIDYE